MLLKLLFRLLFFVFLFNFITVRSQEKIFFKANYKSLSTWKANRPNYYSYVYTENNRNSRKYYRIMQDSSFSKTISKDEKYPEYESFTDNTFTPSLCEGLELKHKNVEVAESWESLLSNRVVEVHLEKIEEDVTYGNLLVEKCFVYKVEETEICCDLLDLRFFIDVKRNLVLRLELYNYEDLQGKRELISFFKFDD